MKLQRSRAESEAHLSSIFNSQTHEQIIEVGGYDYQYFLPLLLLRSPSETISYAWMLKQLVLNWQTPD